MSVSENKSSSPPEESPPILGKWRNLYALVLLLHVFIIFLFYLFGATYA